MKRTTKSRQGSGISGEFIFLHLHRGEGLALFILLLLCTATLSSCGGGADVSTAPPIILTLSGNWQYTLAPPSDGSFLGGLQGGFLLQNGNAVTGSANYAVSLPNLLVPCNTGTATITGTLAGQQVSLTAVAGTQTFTFSGTLSIDSTKINGTYSSTAGTAGDGQPCGTAQEGLQWSAVFVPPLSGPFQGTLQSAGGSAGLAQQSFVLSGGLTQAANSGANSASLVGNVTFLNSITGLSDYPCMTSASLSGQISGNVVTLTMTGSDGSQLGLIGEPMNSLNMTGVNPVTYDSVRGGNILHGAGPSYMAATNSCPGNLGSVSQAGDYGNICVALNGATACQQPITLTPSALIFPIQVIGTPATMQTITLGNASGAALGGVTLNLANSDGVANFTETDNCGVNGVPSLGQPFNLITGQSCDVTISFAPLESCAVGTPPTQCPSSLNANLSATNPGTGAIFTVSITGTGANGGMASSNPSFDDGSFFDQRIPPEPRLARVNNSSEGTTSDAEHHVEVN